MFVKIKMTEKRKTRKPRGRKPKIVIIPVQTQKGGNIFDSIGKALSKPSTYLGLAGLAVPEFALPIAAASKALAMTGNGKKKRRKVKRKRKPRKN
jgi:hypothetical protein